MRILVCGSRKFDNYILLSKTLTKIIWDTQDVTVIEGGAIGADFLARVWAKEWGFEYEEYPADWKTYGKAAGPIRNKQMLIEGKPDLVIAFLAKGSIGTKDMIKQSKEAKVEVKVIEV